jgi:hypothetical protein
MTNTWSTPYYGVSHILREQSGQHQFTVEEHNTFAIATVFPFRSIRNFRDVTFPTVAEAKVWLERQCREMK